MVIPLGGDISRLEQLLYSGQLFFPVTRLSSRRAGALLGRVQVCLSCGDACLSLGPAARVQHGRPKRLQLKQNLPILDGISNLEHHTPGNSGNRRGHDVPVGDPRLAFFLNRNLERPSTDHRGFNQNGLSAKSVGE